MTDTQAKNHALSKIRQEGMVDMYADNGTKDDNEWFFRYRTEFVANDFVAINQGGTHQKPYYEVRLTDRGLSFLESGGY